MRKFNLIIGSLLLSMLFFSSFKKEEVVGPFESISLKKAKKKAKKEGKMVMVLVSTPYCPDCQNIIKELQDQKLQNDYKTKFVSIILNADKVSNNLRLNEWGITKMPALIFLNPSKNKILYKTIGLQTTDSLKSYLTKVKNP